MRLLFLGAVFYFWGVFRKSYNLIVILLRIPHTDAYVLSGYAEYA